MGYGRYIEPKHTVIEQVGIPIPGLPPSLDGFRIAVLADLHFGPFSDGANVPAIVRKVHAAEPDLILLGGDFVSKPEGIAAIATLAALAAPLGVFAVLGNHDYKVGAAAVIAAFNDIGIAVLRNEKVTLPAADTTIELVGIDDVLARRARIEKALGPVARADEPPGVRLVLVHEPDLADDLAGYDIDLQISGHSHGGQVRIPGIGAPILPPLGRRYPLGLQQGPAGWVYTSRGIGMTGIPIRLFCPPEVSILTLRQGSLP